MSISTFSSLLEEWEKSAEKQAGKVPTTVSIYECDEIKLRALAKVYGLPLEEVTASLIHQALLDQRSQSLALGLLHAHLGLRFVTSGLGLREPLVCRCKLTSQRSFIDQRLPLRLLDRRLEPRDRLGALRSLHQDLVINLGGVQGRHDLSRDHGLTHVYGDVGDPSRRQRRNRVLHTMGET